MGGALPSLRPPSFLGSALQCSWSLEAWKAVSRLLINGRSRQFTELWALPRVEAAPGKRRAAGALVPPVFLAVSPPGTQP